MKRVVVTLRARDLRLPCPLGAEEQEEEEEEEEIMSVVGCNLLLSGCQHSRVGW